ncbi:sensor histidine kinase [Amycolatopsis nalaikhensis]|uniref:histidine kinase n=1 Tax=Amycolatopsis nalaikhensis TaxID=715472 RepID=A0ABY8XCP0_9PSEU|nr:histidine kinase [Amycolatopsis sp. 2-2]WIV53239.1 histidine kinase [Amycolatopsis sp. 2-2]
MPAPAVRDQLARALRTTAGLAYGAVTAPAELVFVLSGGLALAVPRARPPVFRAARWFAEVERRRLETLLRSENATDYTGRRAFEYLLPRCVAGLLGTGIFGLVLAGALGGVVILAQLAAGLSPGGEAPADWSDYVVVLLAGVLFVFLCGQGLAGVAKLDRGLAHRFLGPSAQDLLRRRVSELATSRAEVVEAVDGERRRIERDLHDGVQQRLVALGMLLGRARRAKEPEHASELLRQAHEETQRALHDLREVTWRVYPIALDEGGLATALEALAERTGLPVDLRYGLAARPPAAIETVAYFVASEAVTNTVKHAAATRIGIDVGAAARGVRVTITDDGTGGAVAAGGGLSGLRRRVAAVDGEFTVDSPPGGPTVVTAVLPCA